MFICGLNAFDFIYVYRRASAANRFFERINATLRMTLARELACYALNAQFADLPAAVLHEAARSLLNWAGWLKGRMGGSP